ncbi:hypothetical protein CFC21_006254 [Triticum aestivum]|uniref:SHSP domain-containing protein n=4 Tax=Triticum TaxID=4564 RepID=A0A9R0QQV2_TRITD|nr:inactive protein RESTRICTED TEV MOVEMENT 2-like [Triticum aestivum]KAF6988808.1 hypothetical protein CFC21_006254 [Triticum aestivum]VAH15888.1 unnamed protein product [Triticum turgidum subsp. durum]
MNASKVQSNHDSARIQATIGASAKAKQEMEAAGYRSRVVAEVDPRSEWVHGDEFDTLIVDVSGFARDQLKVQVEPLGSLKISGERALNGGRQWCHFLKRFDLPGACDAAAIKVQLDKGVLYVQVPRSTDDSQEDALREEDWSGGHTAAWRADEHPARRLAKSLGEHRYAVLNVVLAVVLLWLVAFANSKQSGGQIKNE